MHREGKIKNMGEKKITQSEFFELVNSAFIFLDCKFSEVVVSEIFSKYQVEGQISYVDYFQIVNK